MIEIVTFFHLLIAVVVGLFIGIYLKVILRKIFKIVPIYEQYRYSDMCNNSEYLLNIKFDNVKEEMTVNILSKYENKKMKAEYFNAKFNYDYYDKLNDRYIYEYLYCKYLPMIRIMNDIISNNVHFLIGGSRCDTILGPGLWSSNESKLDELLKNYIVVL